MSARSRRPLLASVRMESPCQNGEPGQLGYLAVLTVEPAYSMLEQNGILRSGKLVAINEDPDGRIP